LLLSLQPLKRGAVAIMAVAGKRGQALLNFFYSAHCFLEAGADLVDSEAGSAEVEDLEEVDLEDSGGGGFGGGGAGGSW